MLKREDIEIIQIQDKHMLSLLLEARVRVGATCRLLDQELSQGKIDLVEQASEDLIAKVLEKVNGTKELTHLVDQVSAAHTIVVCCTKDLAHATMLDYRSRQEALDTAEFLYKQALDNLNHFIKEGE